MFEADRLKAIGGQDNRDFGGDVFSYTPSSDDLDVIIADNYFEDAFQSLNIDDLIYVITSGGLATLRVVTSGEDGVTTASAGDQGLDSTAAITAAGPIPLSASVVLMTTAAATTYTLGVGFVGQVLTIYLVSDTGDATINPVDEADGFIEKIVFDTVGESVTIKYINDGTTEGWIPLANNGGVLTVN